MSEDLSKYVTDLKGDIFGLRELPEVVKGALLSKYSRTTLGLRTLLEREFLNASQGGLPPLDRAQDFYDRILDGYGDDSIGELGGAHLALENISMLAAKVIEDCRIGGSPLEKSTRYVPFDKLREGRYAYYRDPLIMASPYKGAYEETCDALFRTYSELFSPLMDHLREKTQVSEGGEKARESALKARVFDNLRGLLPAATLTNVGLFGNGRYYEGLLQKLQIHPLQEMQSLGARGFEQLSCMIPSFVRRASKHHPHRLASAEYQTSIASHLSQFARENIPLPETANSGKSRAELVDSDPDAMIKVAAALLYPYTQQPLKELETAVRRWDEGRLVALFETSARGRINRRHKSPRALECAPFTFDLVSDFGCYRDLQRHRMLTQERQLLNASLGYEVPDDVVAAGLQSVYRDAMDRAGELSTQLCELCPQAAQYAVPMGYRLRWYFHVNLRALQWLCELRSGRAGHPAYRLLAQEMCAQVQQAFPPFAAFFQFVDFEGANGGRFEQEKRRIDRRENLALQTT